MSLGRPAWQFALLVLLAGAVMAVGLSPNMGHPLGDKTEHILAFALLALAFSRSRTPLAHPVVCFLLLALAAVALELLQAALSPSRTASWSDAFASLIGIGAGMLCARVQGWRLVLAGAALFVFALAMNWSINVGRYRLFDAITAAAPAAQFQSAMPAHRGARNRLTS